MLFQNRGRRGEICTGSGLLDVFYSIIDSLLGGVEVALLSRLGASGVGQRLGDGFVVAWTILTAVWL